MTMKTLRTVPFQIDAQSIAEGMLEMFDDSERAALRFGMLPYQKMQAVESAFRDRFCQNATNNGNDQFTAYCETEARRQIIDFSMKALVQEAVHEVTLAMYDIGELVV